MKSSQSIPGPLSLVCEITHRCPLHCLYCSNPLALQPEDAELTTETWTRVFREAGRLGVVHLHLTGGEPLARYDLADLVRAGRDAGLYVNLITSAIGMNEVRLNELVEAGLDHIQLSLQDADEMLANRWAGARAHAIKLEMAASIRAHPRLAFTVNIVVHRQNLDRLEAMIALAESMGPDRLEIAHVQYYGWALENREMLLPTHEQVERSAILLKQTDQRLAGRIHLVAVAPDYYARYPKPCVGGWGKQLMLIDPAGRAIPCHSASVIPGLRFDNVRDHELEWIWRDSRAFNHFRGGDWMQEPCRSCERKTVDFGGCRCQAMQLLGDPASTDPACHRSPRHNDLVEIAAKAPAKTDTGFYRFHHAERLVRLQSNP